MYYELATGPLVFKSLENRRTYLAIQGRNENHDVEFKQMILLCGIISASAFAATQMSVKEQAHIGTTSNGVSQTPQSIDPKPQVCGEEATRLACKNHRNMPMIPAVA